MYIIAARSLASKLFDTNRKPFDERVTVGREQRKRAGCLR
jgi:hypothetical protein